MFSDLSFDSVGLAANRANCMRQGKFYTPFLLSSCQKQSEPMDQFAADEPEFEAANLLPDPIGPGSEHRYRLPARLPSAFSKISLRAYV